MKELVKGYGGGSDALTIEQARNSDKPLHELHIFENLFPSEVLFHTSSQLLIFLTVYVFKFSYFLLVRDFE